MSDRPKIGEILLAAGLIDEYQLASALGEQERWGSRLGATLVKLGMVREDDLVRALARQLRVPIAQLGGKRIHPEVLDLIPTELAQKHRCLPLFVKTEAGVRTLFVAMEDPCALDVLDELGFRAGMRVRPVLVGPSDLELGLRRAFDPPPEVIGDFEPATESDTPFVTASTSTAGPDPSCNDGGEIPASGLLRALIEDLVERGLVDAGRLRDRARAIQAKNPLS